MGKINILDKSIFNRIAAGEVVEKPASIVKELVENSIDAGATNISIDITNGGISRVRVSDNGCGIEKDDIRKAFLPHSTSKISCLNDLDKIGTLGFRGEALASIASVSKVTLISKIKESLEGNKIVLNGGEVISEEPAGCTDGTSVIVEDLFYNVPARAKFLRKAKTEENEVTNYVSRLILANPNISIKYTADGKLIFSSQGTGLFDAIYNIYGKSVVNNLIEFEYKDDLFDFKGYLGKPTFSKSNRTYQTLVINGRYVVNTAISTAIYKAFENYIMKGTFPFFVLHLNLPLDKVDVNVHPNKLDVKFEDSNKVFGLVYSSIASKLQEINNVKNVSLFEDDEDNAYEPNKSTLSVIKSNEGSSYKDTILKTSNTSNIDIKSTSEFQKNYEEAKAVFNNSKAEQLQQTPYIVELAEQLTKRQLEEKNATQETTEVNLKETTLDYEPLIKKNISNDSLNEEVNPAVCDQTSLVLNIDDYKILGTLFNTYILIEQGENMLLIDQHAAHERVLYDKFKESFNKRELSIQTLLVPYILELNYLEYEFIKQNLDTLKEIGFELEEFGKLSFKVNTVPLMLKNISLHAFFSEILSETQNGKIVIKKVDAIEDYFAKCACKKAIKANDILGEFEIKILLTKLSNEKQVLLCPHGRPIVLKISKKEIEKWFKRIV